MKDTINKIYDRKTSLPETGNIIPNKKTDALNEGFLKGGR